MNKSSSFILTIAFLLLCSFSALGQTASPDAVNSKSEAPQLKQAEGNRYRLNPGDVLDIIYRYTPEFNQTITIQPDGFVMLEIAGELKIGGLTVEQARQEILKSAAKRLKDPEINILLKQFQKPYFVVSGEVVQPGKFELNENVTALQAVLLAGGFKDSAKASQILVFRKINSETAEVKMLNLKGIKKTGDLENDFRLQSGDMLMVPRNMFTKLERYVKFAGFADFFRPFLF